MKKLLFLFVFSLLFVINPEENIAAENLQSLIDSLEEGAVLKLEDRTYEGNLVLMQPITIIGTGKTVIKGDGTGNVISIKAPNVTLKHLTVTNGSMNRNSPEEYAAIKIHTNGNLVEHIKVRDSFHGIYLSQAHENTIRYTDIKGMGKEEIAAQGNGIHVYYANDNILSHNTIEGTRDGMYFDYANNNESYENNISNTRYGLHYMYSHKNTFRKNIFTMNNGGAAIMNSNHLLLEDNHFIVNYGNKSFGLLLLQSTDNQIMNNTFYMNQRGLYIDQSTRNHIEGNKITQNQIGIELWASSNEQIFTQNQITENTIPAVTIGGTSESNSWSNDTLGNDWGSSFPLTDLNQDGLGDFPITYQSSLYQLIEEQELSYLFLKSPAIPIFEKMNTLLQDEKVMFNDPYPLAAKKGNAVTLLIVGFALIFVLTILKGRHRLCIIFGRNGKKT